MITEEEKKFFEYWEKNRLKEKNIFHHIGVGLPLGLLIGAGILISFTSGWYQRANMVAFSQSTPIVLILGLVIITVFCALLYKRHKWDRNEYRYTILQRRKELENTGGIVQQNEEGTSQSILNKD